MFQNILQIRNEIAEKLFDESNLFPDFTYKSYVKQHWTKFNLEPDHILIAYIRSRLLQKIEGKDIQFTKEELKILFDLSDYKEKCV